VLVNATSMQLLRRSQRYVGLILLLQGNAMAHADISVACVYPDDVPMQPKSEDVDQRPGKKAELAEQSQSKKEEGGLINE